MTLNDLRSAVKELEHYDGELEVCVELGAENQEDEWQFFRHLHLADIILEKGLLTRGGNDKIVITVES